MKNKMMRIEVRNKIVMRKRQTSDGVRLEKRNISMKNKRMRIEVRNKIVMRKRQTSDGVRLERRNISMKRMRTEVRNKLYPVMFDK